MFLSFSKFIGKSKFRIGAGMRLTKSNVWYMLFILMIYWMFVLCFYMMALCIWMMYAMIYGLVWLVKKIVKKIKN